jgi:hypothetical protein
MQFPQEERARGYTEIIAIWKQKFITRDTEQPEAGPMPRPRAATSPTAVHCVWPTIYEAGVNM